MSPAKPKTLSCPLCQGTTFKKKIATYPMRTFDGRQIHIGRVAVQECQNCRHLLPTKAGSEKISRCMAMMATIFYDD
jgi:YgiT-type zinc finger domain-containing protein